MEKPINLAIADDQTLFLKGLKYIIDTFDNIRLKVIAENGRQLLDQLEHEPVDVVLLDLNMPVMDGIETVRHLKKDYPHIKVIFLTMYDDDRLIAHVMEIGANGYLLKDEEAEVVREAIESVMRTGFYFNDYVSKALLRDVKNKGGQQSSPKFQPRLDLTRREMEILELICREYPTNEIANKLFISPRTVEGHRKNLLEKTGVKNTAGLVIYALKNKLVDLI